MLFTTGGHKGFICIRCNEPCKSENNKSDMFHICKCGAQYKKNHPASPIWHRVDDLIKTNQVIKRRIEFLEKGET